MGLTPHGVAGAAAAAGTAALAVLGINGGGGGQRGGSIHIDRGCPAVRGVLSLLARTRAVVDGARQIARVHHRKLHMQPRASSQLRL
jgi:hypothetical protein